MKRKGVIIDTMSFTIVRECSYDDKVIEGLFYKIDGIDGGLVPVAYIYPVSPELDEVLANARRVKKEYDAYVANLYYKVFPSLRAKK